MLQLGPQSEVGVGESYCHLSLAHSIPCQEVALDDHHQLACHLCPPLVASPTCRGSLPELAHQLPADRLTAAAEWPQELSVVVGGQSTGHLGVGSLPLFDILVHVGSQGSGSSGWINLAGCRR